MEWTHRERVGEEGGREDVRDRQRGKERERKERSQIWIQQRRYVSVSMSIYRQEIAQQNRTWLSGRACTSRHTDLLGGWGFKPHGSPPDGSSCHKFASTCIKTASNLAPHTAASPIRYFNVSVRKHMRQPCDFNLALTSHLLFTFYEVSPSGQVALKAIYSCRKQLKKSQYRLSLLFLRINNWPFWFWALVNLLLLCQRLSTQKLPHSPLKHLLVIAPKCLLMTQFVVHICYWF